MGVVVAGPSEKSPRGSPHVRAGTVREVILLERDSQQQEREKRRNIHGVSQVSSFGGAVLSPTRPYPTRLVSFPFSLCHTRNDIARPRCRFSPCVAPCPKANNKCGAWGQNPPRMTS